MPTIRYSEKSSRAGSHGDLTRMIRSGEAVSRAQLVRLTGMAPSTISARVEGLLGSGLIRESGAEDSRGGRRARRLEVNPDAGIVAAAELGSHHVLISISDLLGRTIAQADVSEAVTVERDPADTVEALWTQLVAIVEASGLDPARLVCIAVGVPAPVDYPTGQLRTPSFQPGWHGANLAQLFARHTAIPVLIENDANLIALAEKPRGSGRGAAGAGLIAVKIGTRIGGGVVLGGTLQRGISGAAGEFSHSPVAAESIVGCACGIHNCLESVASGRAMMARLAASGHEVETTEQLVAMAAAGDPAVVAVLRDAGEQIGRSLAAIVNFINPSTVVVAGALASAPQLVAAIRGELFRHCLPLVAEELEIRVSDTPTSIGLRGATQLALDEVFAPARIDAA